MVSIHVFVSALNMSDLSFCYFRIAHGSDSGYKWIKVKILKLFLQLVTCICKRESFTKILQCKEITEKIAYK